MSYPYQITSYDDYKLQYCNSVENPEAFWAKVAGAFAWRKPWDKVLEWNFVEPRVKWFEGAKLNITENCLDRHLENLGEKPAIIWEPNDPNEASRTITYRQLLEQVSQFAHVLRNNGRSE